MRKLFIICALLFCLGTASAQQKFSVASPDGKLKLVLDIAPEKVAYSVKYGKQQLLGGLKAGIRVRQRGVRGRAQGGKGTKEENRRGLRAGSGEGPQSEELLQRDDSAPGGKEWEGENSEPNCKSIR